LFTPLTPLEQRERYFADLVQRLRMGEPLAISDITFIDDDNAEERVAFEALQKASVADKPLAFAAWNTTANSVGTSLSAATCAGLAARAGLATQPARETFLFDRYVDDYAYRLLVRPSLNVQLRNAGYDTFALGDASDQTETTVRHDLWPIAVDLFDQNFSASWNRNELGIYLPWQRTFEVRLSVALSSRS
jgi:hypothetical protein